MSGLTEEEVALLSESEEVFGVQGSAKKKTSKKPPEGKFSDLFRYATCWDNILYIVGALFACVQGAGWPLISVIFGQMTNTFITPSNATNTSILDADTSNVTFSEEMTKFALYYTYISSAVFVACYFQIACMVTACEHQTHKIRKKLFESILRQDIAWFDEHPSGELTSRLANDLDRVREGIGDKLSMTIQSVATCLSGFAIGFYMCWQMTLVMMSMTPLLALCGFFAAKFMASYAQKEAEIYAKAGSVAEEVFSCIKTVVSFRGQYKEIRRFSQKVQDSQALGIKRVMVSSVGFGLHYFIIYASYSLSYWYGSTLVADDVVSAGTVFTVFFCVLVGSFALGGIAPNLSQVATAKAAAAKIFEIIDRVPAIDASCPFGLKRSSVQGKITLQNINFCYPSRPNVQVMNDLNLSVRAGQTVALVGSSGCGKSTLVNLIQRFYDPDDGQVSVDGQDVKTFNIKWLREQIGVVSQEPVLFGCSIAENIKYGRLDITQSQIKEAARVANVHDFIKKLPKGYETLVGERGAQLSGGQKQRVAIARALVRNPKILLLDEATSALDRESERSVQVALDKASEGRTTIVIAHRLSTIKNVDMIYVLDHGVVVEAGNHDDLMERGGNYYNLVKQQKLSDKDDTESALSTLSQTNKSFRGSIRRRGLSMSHREPLLRSLSVSLYQTPMQTSVGYYDPDGDEAFVIGEGQEEEEPVAEAGYCEIFALNKPETCYIIIGCIASLIMGGTMPIFSVLFSELIRVFTKPKEVMLQEALFWSMSFLGLACSSGISQFLMQAMFGISGERLTTRLREKTFESYVRQDISWFDDPKHSTGALTTRLASDAPVVQSATGSRLGLVLQGFCSIVVGLTIAVIYGWQLALALGGCTPILIIAGVLQIKLVLINQKRDSELLENAGKIASEAIENMKTIQSLTRERMFYRNYCDFLKAPYRENIKQAQIYGVAYAFSQSFLFFMYAGGFRFGAYLVAEGIMAAPEVYRVFFAVAFSGMIVGQVASYLPDYSKAKHSASLILNILNSRPKIDSFSTLGIRLNDCTGTIAFKDVVFSYANRPELKVLKGLSMTVSPGQTVALVGPSGAGKSTVISLLQRFYDPESGQILLDDVNITNLNVNWLRSQIGVVGQEPVLFGSSIKDNMAYGVEGDITDYDVMDAAKIANIHEFIMSLPDGYDTLVGEKGTQLSGGQKQRIAIARALICNPQILLLDEATSALDTESEKSVQAALDKAREGRSCIVIAHRLSTIQHADKIIVIDNGIVVETGTHKQLLDKKGAYCALTFDKRRREHEKLASVEQGLPVH